MKAIPSDLSHGTVSFQIAPMIDVVFVIMLFFMVMAGSVRVEKELNTQLPSATQPTQQEQAFDEAIITVNEDGSILLNDDPVDSLSTGQDLPELKAALLKLNQASTSSKSPLMVTILSEQGAKYSRTIDVVNACSAAKIDRVTFGLTQEEE